MNAGPGDHAPIIDRSDRTRLFKLAKAVRMMRAYQTAYFKRRDKKTLAHALESEKRVDKMVAIVLDTPQPSLFPLNPEGPR